MTFTDLAATSLFGPVDKFVRLTQQQRVELKFQAILEPFKFYSVSPHLKGSYWKTNWFSRQLITTVLGLFPDLQPFLTALHRTNLT